MGLLYKSVGRIDPAEKHFLNALALEPRYPPAYTQLGILEMERHNDETALKYFRKALTHEVNSKQERNYAGVVLLKQKKLKKAITQFRKSLKDNPEDREYLLTHLGAAYKYKGETGNAIDCLKRVIKINPNHVPAQLHLIECYALKGRTAKADQIAHRLISLFSSDQIDLLFDKMIFQGDILVEPPNMKVVGPFLEKALKMKGSDYFGLALKLEDFRNQ